MASERLLVSRHALLPQGLVEDVVVRVRGREILEVRPATAADPAPEPGLLVPGLVNAHLHLELGWAAGQVPGGEGLPSWVSQLVRQRPPPGWAPSAAALVQSGTAAVSDISNAGATAEVLSEAGLAGVVHHELLGMSPSRWEGALAQASQPPRQVGALWVRPSPHATYSTPPQLIQACCRPGPAPASIHLAEDPAEEAFTRHGTGGFAEMMARAGIDSSWWVPPGRSPAGYLESLGVLGPQLLLVHGVHLDEQDMRLVAERRSPLCLCPRSNLHIGGRLPDVPALLAAGIHCCLGTDSEASSPDLDVLAEIPALARAWPAVPVERWLRLATQDGADALGLPRYGRITAGASPGLVRLRLDRPEDLLAAPPPREWCA
jgi:cytosine/adenosine deaminase-related metal-dependent hydrolase